MDLIAGLAFGLVAGAWVDRLRRRPVLVGADLGRALLLGLIPLAAIGGWLSMPLLLIVTLLTAVLTTFFDAADNAFLPSIVPRGDLVRANGALAASSSVSEFAAFGSAGFLVQILTAPIAIFVDALSFVVSAAPAVHDPRQGGRAADQGRPRAGPARDRRRPSADRPSADPARHDAGVDGHGGDVGRVQRDVVPVRDRELGLDAAAIGIIAAVGGISSLFAALLTARATRRFGVGAVVIGGVADRRARLPLRASRASRHAARGDGCS